MNYTLNQLKIFVTVAQCQSITKASEELHLTQPAVSIQLKNLQNQFEVPLWEVIGRQLHITPFGKQIQKKAEIVLEKVDEIKHENDVFKGLITGKLKISSVSTGKYVMPYFLNDFLKLHPQIELQMDVTNKTEVLSDLSENRVDFALVSILPDSIAVEDKVLMDNSLYLVGNESIDLKKYKTIDELFAEQPLISREKGSGTRQTMEKFLMENNISYTKKMELTSNEAVKQAVIAGLGVSIMPIIGIRTELNAKKLQIIPFKGLPLTTEWRMTWPKGKQHSPITKAYLDFIDNQKEKIIQEHFNILSQELKVK